MNSEAIVLTEPVPDTYELRTQSTFATVKSWTLVAVLFFTPLVTYWPTIFHYYGLRDGYSNLREAHEEPGKIVQFCASGARPIYGRLLQATFGYVNTVHDLQWIRLLS